MSDGLKFDKEQFKPQTMDSPYTIEDDTTSFLQDEFFGAENIRVTDEVTVEYEQFESRILDYSVKGAEPNIIDMGRRGSRKFEIPLISVSLPISAEQGDFRGVGELPVNSGKTPADRLNRLVLQTESRLSRMFKRTREKQCADLLLNGKIEMNEMSEGKLVSKRVATFDKTVRVDVGTKWDTPGTDIYEQLWQYGTELRKTTGRNFKLILGSDAFKHFTKNEYIQKILDLRNFNIGNYSPGDAQKNGKYKGVAYVGALTIAGVGTINIYTYNAYYYKDDAETHVPYIDTKVALLLPENNIGVYNYGSMTLLNKDTSKYVTVEAKEYSQYFINDRLNTIEIIKHSKPLPVPYPNLKWKALKVVS